MIFSIKKQLKIKLTSINSFKHPLHENKIEFFKKMTRLCKKKKKKKKRNIVHFLVFWRLPSLFMFSSKGDDLWLVQRCDFNGGFSLRCSDWSMSKTMPRWSNTGKTFNRWWISCLMSKINHDKTLFEFVAKLFNLDEKVIKSFLILIAKKKLDEKWTLSLISISVSFLVNAQIII